MIWSSHGMETPKQKQISATKKWEKKVFNKNSTNTKKCTQAVSPCVQTNTFCAFSLLLRSYFRRPPEKNISEKLEQFLHWISFWFINEQGTQSTNANQCISSFTDPPTDSWWNECCHFYNDSPVHTNYAWISLLQCTTTKVRSTKIKIMPVTDTYNVTSWWQTFLLHVIRQKGCIFEGLGWDSADRNWKHMLLGIALYQQFVILSIHCDIFLPSTSGFLPQPLRATCPHLKRLSVHATVTDTGKTQSW